MSEREADAWEGIDLAEMLGGRRGILDATAPGVALAVVKPFTTLGWAIVAACGTALVISILRRLRGEPLRQAVMGLGGLAFAAGIAALTGNAKNYFLPGILLNLAYAMVAIVSVAVRRPLLGYAAAVLDRGYGHWREDSQLRRSAMWATVVWAAVFASRAAVQGYLFAHGKVGWLVQVRLGMGLPLTALALAVTLLLLEGNRREPEPAPEPA